MCTVHQHSEMLHFQFVSLLFFLAFILFRLRSHIRAIMKSSEISSKLKAFPFFPVMMALTFLTSGTIMCLLLLLSCLLVWPFSHHYYRQLSYYLIYPVWSQLVFLIDWWAPSDVLLFMEKKDQDMIGKEHAVVVMNHSYDIDWLVGWLICERSELLAATKVFAKRSLSFVPIIGWIWRMAEIIFLDRNWQTDKSIIVKQIAQISQYFNPVWILLFPEGTRFTPSKHKASVEFAIKQGLVPLKHLLIPRTKGFVLSIQAIKESGRKVAAIYDTTIAFDTGSGYEPTIMNVIKGRPMKAQVKVCRIPIESVPVEDAACERWLQDLFQRKDQLLQECFKTGSFQGRSGHLPQRTYSLINYIFWTVLVWGFVFYYAIFCASSVSLGLMVVSCGVLSIALDRMAEVTVSSKGSTYGKASVASTSNENSS